MPGFKTIPTPVTTGNDRITGATQLTSDWRRVRGLAKIGAEAAAAGSSPRRSSSSLSASISPSSCSLVLLPFWSLKVDASRPHDT
jgi:hypothetical protein